MALFTPLTSEQKESALRNFLPIVAAQTNLAQLKCLLQIVLKLVNGNIITAR